MGLFDRLRGKGPRRKPRYIKDKPIHDWTLEPELRMIRDLYAKRLEEKEALEAQIPEAEKQAALQAEEALRKQAADAARLRVGKEAGRPAPSRKQVLETIIRYFVQTGRVISDAYRAEAKELGIDIPEGAK